MLILPGPCGGHRAGLGSYTWKGKHVKDKENKTHEEEQLKEVGMFNFEKKRVGLLLSRGT